MRALVTTAWIVAVLAISDTSIAAETSGYVVIVNSDVRIGELDRDFVRDIYLKKTIEWGGGTTIHPIDLSAPFAVRDQFVRDVLHKTPAQLKNYWNQQIFSGKGVPPPETDSAAAVIAYVVSHPGAIGYIPAGVDPGHARVVHVK